MSGENTHRAEVETYFEYDEDNFDGELTRGTILRMVHDHLSREVEVVDHALTVERVGESSGAETVEVPEDALGLLVSLAEADLQNPHQFDSDTEDRVADAVDAGRDALGLD